MTRPTARQAATTVLTLCLIGLSATVSAQVLETETARPLAKGVLEIGANLEVQTSSEGREIDVPLVFEYGLTDRLGLLIEPVASSAFLPNVGPRAHTVGDTEVTGIYLLSSERQRWPAFALAGEVKLPTAESRLIGTDHTDFAGILILSKRFGNVETHGNFSYTFVGQPAGAALSNIMGGALALEAPIGRRFRIYGELLASSGATPGNEGHTLPSTMVVTEAASQEMVGSIGLGVYVHPKVFLSLGVSYDNNGAILFRPGLTFRSR